MRRRGRFVEYSSLQLTGPPDSVFLLSFSSLQRIRAHNSARDLPHLTAQRQEEGIFQTEEMFRFGCTESIVKVR